MASLDSVFQDAVDQEIDRLARLSPCELMQLAPRRWSVETAAGPVNLQYKIDDLGDVRHIAVLADRPVLLGIARRRFAGGLKVELRMTRMSDLEVVDLYD